MRALLWLCVVVCLGGASTAPLAQNQPATPSAAAASQAASDTAPPPSVDELRKQLDAVPQKLGEDDDGRKRVTEVNAIGSAAEQLVTRRTEELVDLDSRLAGLGPAPEKGAAPDAFLGKDRDHHSPCHIGHSGQFKIGTTKAFSRDGKKSVDNESRNPLGGIQRYGPIRGKEGKGTGMTNRIDKIVSIGKVRLMLRLIEGKDLLIGNRKWSRSFLQLLKFVVRNEFV